MLTPLDIENKRFSKTIKGYNVEEVDDFLDELTVEYEKLYKENAEFKTQIEQSKKDLEHYRSVEHTLQNTLVMAQTTAEDIKNMAHKQADQIIRDAQGEARRSIDELNKEEFDVKRRLEDVKRQFDVYKAKMEALLISQLELLQDKNENE
ncbi:MAG: DivIVA domain-containing protein [Clostridia bacterium]|jgi:cell division initiation protein|nr:DivIVA domain-containing protein [Clostridia bacterium]